MMATIQRIEEWNTADADYADKLKYKELISSLLSLLTPTPIMLKVSFELR